MQVHTHIKIVYIRKLCILCAQKNSIGKKNNNDVYFISFVDVPQICNATCQMTSKNDSIEDEY